MQHPSYQKVGFGICHKFFSAYSYSGITIEANAHGELPLMLIPLHGIRS